MSARVLNKIKSWSFKTEVRRNFFSQKVVNPWNSLPQRVVEAGSLEVFKVVVDKYVITFFPSIIGRGTEKELRPA